MEYKCTRCYGNKAYQHKPRVSMIAGFCNNQIIAQVIFEGNCNRSLSKLVKVVQNYKCQRSN
ncbi:IS630 family transposase [Orientia tsutsugamushi]|nr:IS630 family transposase [Orientia tsutsugamushi]